MNFFQRFNRSNKFLTDCYVNKSIYSFSSVVFNHFYSDLDNLKLPSASSLSPALKQYHSLKQQYPDHILLFRWGDFYEIYWRDAEIASQAADLTLTKRPGRKKDAEPVPMSGLPHHSLDNYIQKFIRKGYRVAVCDQLETAEEAKKNKRSIIKREITRVVTPGTLFEDNLLEPKDSSYLASVHVKGDEIALSWLELSTGKFSIGSSSETSLSSDLARINPVELLLTQELRTNDKFAKQFDVYNITIREEEKFNEIKAMNLFKESFPEKIKELENINMISSEYCASGALLDYLKETQKGNTVHLRIPERLGYDTVMLIDSPTRKSLELTTNLSGGSTGTLLNVIDRTVTPLGARLLANRLKSPILDSQIISDRLDTISFFVDNFEIVEKIRDILSQCYDLERCLQRLRIQRGTPRDLGCIAATLKQCQDLFNLFELPEYKDSFSNMPLPLKEILTQLTGYEDLIKLLSEALVDSPPLAFSEGGFVLKGYSKELDNFRELSTNGKTHLQKLTDTYKEKTGLSGLKLKSNSTHLGYFLEIPTGQKSKIEEHSDLFIHVQSLLNTTRYKTKELNSLQSDIQTSSMQAINLEMNIFSYLCSVISDSGDQIENTASALAKLDLNSALSVLSTERSYCRPIIDDSKEFNISGGRHPSVENVQSSGENATNFVDNDCILTNKEDIWLITGPNMGGKSTFLRQNAIITILAQIGSFVPASSAHIGIVDKVFSRVGAADDLIHDKSTFMVEMTETASILDKATSRSFVIMDEIGRGTSTTDGLSIAWAVLEYLSNVNSCRTLFATHYHELCKIVDDFPNIGLKTMDVIHEKNDQVIFLHKIITGVSNESYGINCAKLAGVPDPVIERAKQILSSISSKNLDLNSISCSNSRFEDNLEKSTNFDNNIIIEDEIDTNDSTKNDSLENNQKPNIPAISLEITNRLKSLNLEKIDPNTALLIVKKLTGMAHSVKIDSDSQEPIIPSILDKINTDLDIHVKSKSNDGPQIDPDLFKLTEFSKSAGTEIADNYFDKKSQEEITLDFDSVQNLEEERDHVDLFAK